MKLTEKIKIAMIKTNTTQVTLAERTGQTQGNLANKFARDNFKLSDFENLVEALGCKLEINIVMPDGTKI